MTAPSAKELEYVKDLPGFERGHPHYFREPVIDHLLEVVLLLGGELWVNRDRQMIMEELLATRGKVTPAMIEAFEPDEAFTSKQDEARRKFTQRVYGCLQYEGLEKPETGFFDIVAKTQE
jgi:hypothetical protein